jgi:hypothetical protein
MQRRLCASAAFTLVKLSLAIEGSLPVKGIKTALPSTANELEAEHDIAHCSIATWARACFRKIGAAIAKPQAILAIDNDRMAVGAKAVAARAAFDFEWRIALR